MHFAWHFAAVRVTSVGLKYRDGGAGILRPAMIRLGGDPVPGICQGLKMGLTGMR